MSAVSLYRHFDANGVLLYVGISLSWPARTKAHAYGSRWFDQVARVEIESFATRDAALEAERLAILNERPRFNVIHNRSRKPERSPRKRRDRILDPLLRTIKGPVALVGPALCYRDDLLSVLVAHGEAGSPGEITEVVLGRWFPDAPEWTDSFASVISIRRADEMTMAEASEARDELSRKLRRHLSVVEEYSTDLALAVANASFFPSEKSRQIVDQVASEQEAAA